MPRSMAASKRVCVMANALADSGAWGNNVAAAKEPLATHCSLVIILIGDLRRIQLFINETSKFDAMNDR